MTNEDKKLWDDESPVYVDWFDVVFDVVICLLVAGIIFFGSFIVAKADIHTYGPIAGSNRQLVRCIENSKEYLERKARLDEIEARRQRLEEEKKNEEAKSEKLMQIFGYIPSEDEIQLCLMVTMAECGNT